MTKEKFSEADKRKAAVEGFVAGAAAALVLGGLAKRLAREGKMGYMDWEDILQDAHEKMLRAAGGFEGRSQISTWGHRIVFNKVQDAKERLRTERRAELEDPERTLSLITNEELSPEEALLQKEDHAELIGLIEQLPNLNERRVLLYFYFGDLQEQEIAAHLDMPIGTVKSHKSRGLEKIRQLQAAQSEAASTKTPQRRGVFV